VAYGGEAITAGFHLAIFFELSLRRKGRFRGMKGHFRARRRKSGAFEPAQTRSSSDFQRLCSLLFGILAATQKKQMGKTISIWPSTNRF
jgi:hypothetical protein